MPMNFLPYRDFSRITSNSRHTFSSSSDSSSNGKSSFARNFACRSQLSFEMPSTVVFARLNAGVQVAEVLAFERAAGVMSFG